MILSPKKGRAKGSFVVGTSSTFDAHLSKAIECEGSDSIKRRILALIVSTCAIRLPITREPNCKRIGYNRSQRGAISI